MQSLWHTLRPSLHHNCTGHAVMSFIMLFHHHMREVLEEFNLFTPQPQHVQCSPYATSQSESADKKSVKCNLIRSCVVQCGVISSNRVTVAVVVTGSLFNS